MCAKNILVAAVLLAIVPMVAVAQDCTVDLVADGGSADTAITIGTVTVLDNGDTWTVTYETVDPWEIEEIHVHAACEYVDFPQTKKGNPRVGKFDYSAEYDPAVQIATIEDVEDPECCVGYVSTLVAAHADVVDPTDCEDVTQPDGTVITVCRDETAWGAGTDFEGSNWAMYFECLCP